MACFSAPDYCRSSWQQRDGLSDTVTVIVLPSADTLREYDWQTVEGWRRRI